MPKYRVHVTRTWVEDGVFVTEADNRDEAYTLAKEALTNEEGI